MGLDRSVVGLHYVGLVKKMSVVGLDMAVRS